MRTNITRIVAVTLCGDERAMLRSLPEERDVQPRNLARAVREQNCETRRAKIPRGASWTFTSRHTPGISRSGAFTSFEVVIIIAECYHVCFFRF